MNWFKDARYGMFIHWGAYSVAGRGEWVANRERIARADYERLYAENFRAENYDPSAWAALAVEAGMRYVVLTTRHHDGFALWPTQTTDFHAGRIGPQRDLVGPFVEAIRAAGLRVGLYFSPADWFHPDYPGPHFRDWPGPGDWKDSGARERFIAYYRAQLRELLTGYGKIDYLWFDGCIPEDLQSREANEEVLALQPEMLINERNGPPCHVKVSEQAIRAGEPEELWEACLTLNENWGYHPGDTAWKNSADVLRMLLRTASQDGNLLLNVGPRADGSIPEESAKILRQAGDWLRRNGESIQSLIRSPFTWNNWGAITTSESCIYLHLWHRPGPELCVADIANRVLGARFLDGGKPIPFEQQGDRLFLRELSFRDPLVTTVVLEVEGKPATTMAQTNFWIPG